ncbi:MAG: uracil-DNA glycosylase [Clostridia bacterium]|nr:uracil-DNA glycosylase [Clostridia bacterium]
MTIQAVNKLYDIDFPHRTIVKGDGLAASKIMLIGEAPGREEVEQGKPFVGKAGKNLAEFMQVLGIERKNIFITNTVKFRPVKISDCNTVSNRPPTDDEIRLFLPYLLKEIDVISPKIIVTLGNTPLKALLGGGVTVGKLHGTINNFGGRTLYALYHPAAIIYNPPLKDVYINDLKKLKNILG